MSNRSIIADALGARTPDPAPRLSRAFVNAAVAAIILIGGVRLALPIERGEFPHLRAWYERLAARPAFRKHVMLPLT